MCSGPYIYVTHTLLRDRNKSEKEEEEYKVVYFHAH